MFDTRKVAVRPGDSEGKDRLLIQTPSDIIIMPYDLGRKKEFFFFLKNVKAKKIKRRRGREKKRMKQGQSSQGR